MWKRKEKGREKGEMGERREDEEKNTEESGVSNEEEGTQKEKAGSQRTDRRAVTKSEETTGGVVSKQVPRNFPRGATEVTKSPKKKRSYPTTPPGNVGTELLKRNFKNGTHFFCCAIAYRLSMLIFCSSRHTDTCVTISFVSPVVSIACLCSVRREWREDWRRERVARREWRGTAGGGGVGEEERGEVVSVLFFLLVRTWVERMLAVDWSEARETEREVSWTVRAWTDRTAAAHSASVRVNSGVGGDLRVGEEGGSILDLRTLLRWEGVEQEL